MAVWQRREKQVLAAVILVCGLVLGVWGQRKPAFQGKPLTLADILGVLSLEGRSAAVKNRLLVEGVRQRGVKFTLTPEIEQALRETGASDELITAIRDKTVKPTPTPTPTPTSTRRPPIDSEPTLPGVTLNSFDFTSVTLDRRGKVIARPKGTARSYQETLPGGVTLEMVAIPTGTFLMGSPANEESHESDEGPQHSVTVPAFFMGRYEVTQAQYEAVRQLDKVTIDLPANPSYFKDSDDLPVERVTWNQAKEFCARLSRATGRTYRLPTEAQWEYAARAGTDTPFAFGATITPDIVNYDSNYPYADVAKDGSKYRQETFSVSSGIPNLFGLYNLHGNVYEWNEDEYRANYEGAPTDGSAVGFTKEIDASNGLRVLRGGSWYNNARNCRSANRRGNDPSNVNSNVGFRVVVLPAR